ncbi:molecular chaperone DnaK [Candidatus Gracilibacteria bacterium]|nr:molecular chaperone DnaK [Candidatus Gracilibacteria bacterium]
MSKIIGIDLGTTNSCVSFMEGGESKIIPNAEGGRTTPSVVAFKKGETIVGMPARRQAVTNPKNTIYSAKRFIGRKFSEVKDEIKNVPFTVTEGKDGGCLIEWNGKGIRPEEISAKVLEKLKDDAEKYLGQKVTEAVITVPAYFNDDERQATINAGKIAGLDVKRIVNEPTAAALAYGVDKSTDKKIAVYDFGGGTFDISILEIGSEGTFEVLATNGDTSLGGDDFDQAIFEYVMSEFKSETGIDLSGDAMAVQRVRSASEKAKIELSSATSTDINEPFIAMNDGVPSNLNVTITRAKFEELIGDLVEKSIEPCKKVLSDSGLQASQIDEVILVGGSTRVPLVKTKVEQFFGKKPSEGVNPDEAVAMGAAIQAGIIQGDVNDVLLLDVTPLSLGIETLGGVMTRMIERNTTIPASKSQVYSTAADNQDSVQIHILQGEREMASDNKSLGQFILSGIAPAPRGVPQIEVTFDIDASGVLHVTAKDKGPRKGQRNTIQGDVNDVLLLDVTPLSLGIETLGGVMTRMIERNTTIPASKSQVYSTAADNQDSVQIHILQGEREMASDNKSLGQFILSGIAPAPRGVPQIEVTFDIDASGVLHVTAKDKGTGKEQKITVQGSTGMSDEDVENLVKEAEANREADKKKKESIESRNQADSLVYQSQKTLDDNKDKYEEADGKEAQEKIEALKKVLEKSDATKEEIDEASKPLSDVMMKIGQTIYSKGGNPEGQSCGTDAGSDKKKDDDDSVEAEVEEEK